MLSTKTTPSVPPSSRRLTPLWRASVEIGSIVFLFYSNLLMGEFTASRQRDMTFATAFSDIVTVTNFAIAIVSATLGYVVFETLRRRHR